MDVFVPLQMLLQGKRLVTLITFKRLDVRVNGDPVILQVSVDHEGFGTDVTDKRLLTSVPHLMTLKPKRGHESLTAFITGKRFFR